MYPVKQIMWLEISIGMLYHNADFRIILPWSYENTGINHC